MNQGFDQIDSRVHYTGKKWNGKPDHRTLEEIQFSLAWWRNLTIILVFVVVLLSLILNSVFVYGMSKSSDMMVKTSDATVDMHYQTTKMRTDVISWWTKLMMPYPTNQDEIWLSRFEQLSNDTATIVSTVKRVFSGDNMDINNMIKVGVSTAVHELVDDETRLLINMKIRETLNMISPTEIANTIKNANSVMEEVKAKHLLSKVATILDDGNILFDSVKGFLTYREKMKVARQ